MTNFILQEVASKELYLYMNIKGGGTLLQTTPGFIWFYIKEAIKNEFIARIKIINIRIFVQGPFFTTICSHLYPCTGTLFYHNLFTFVSLYWNPFLPQFVHICNRTFWLIWYVSPMISNMDRMWVLWPELKEYKSQLLISDTQ